MLPSALPTFLKTRRAPVSLSVMATGYFAVWVASGTGIYALGVAFAAAAMRWEVFSRAVPVLSGASLIAAGAFQFTSWKTTGLLRCRSPFGCASVCPERETNFRLGYKQGMACCLCCAAPSMILVVLGMMNPFVIIGVGGKSPAATCNRRAARWHCRHHCGRHGNPPQTRNRVASGAPWRSGDRAGCQQNRKNRACKAPKKCGFGFVTDGIGGGGRFSTNARKSRNLRKSLEAEVGIGRLMPGFRCKNM